MSGGSYDYFCWKLSNFIDDNKLAIINSGESPRSKVARSQFMDHLTLVQEALHAIEWVDSGDTLSDSEVIPILNCFKPMNFGSVPNEIDKVIDYLQGIKDVCTSYDEYKKAQVEGK